MAWPDRPWTLPLLVELAFGADVTGADSDWTWTDVSADLLSQQVSITRGQSSEAAQASPTSVSLVLDNGSGAYTPGNPLSPHYPAVGVGTPCRISVGAGEPYLRLLPVPTSYARTPDAEPLRITGDLDLRIEATCDWYAAGITSPLGRWVSETGQRSYMMALEDQWLCIYWSPTGTGTFFARQPLPALPRRAALRATLDVDNGAGGHTAVFYWAPTMDGPWTQFGSTVTFTPPMSIHAGTAPLEIGPPAVSGTVPFRGTVHRAEVRAGIDGTVVATPDVRDLPEGTTSWTDAAGREWTLGPDAEISTRQYRFVGSVAEWAPTWPYGDLSGPDSPGESRVAITAAGILRRLGQPRKELDSTLRRRIPSAESLVAYWPMEEDQTTGTQAFSPIEGVPPLSLTGADWASDGTLGGSAPLPTVKTPTILSARVPVAATAGWQIEWVYHVPALPAAQTEVMRLVVTGAAMRTVILYASAAAILLEVRSADGTVIGAFSYTNAAALAAFAGKWNRLAIYTGDYGGGATLVTATWRDVTTNQRYYVGTAPLTGPGRIATVSGTWGAALDGMSVGHIAVFSTPGTGVLGVPPTTTIFEGADDGFAGETAGARLLRLCREEEIPMQLLGPPSVTTRMGPQRPGKLLDLLVECANVDGGILGEQLDLPGLQYRPRPTLYNQGAALVLDAGRSEITNPFAPVLDDQGMRNASQVTRSGGSSAVAVDEESVTRSGLYDEQITVNAHRDDQLAGIAEWRVHLGTWPGMRYPSVASELAMAPELVGPWMSLDLGDRVQVVGLPPQHAPDPVDVLATGYTETLSPTRWSLGLTCQPAGPWQVGVVEDPVLGRADTDGSALTGSMTESATTASVLTGTGLHRWIDSATYGAMFPFDVRVGGEVMRVTACTGTGLSQVFTVARGINGIRKPHSSGTPVRLADPMRAAL